MFEKIRGLSLGLLLLFSLGVRADDSKAVLFDYAAQLIAPGPTASASPVALAPATAKQLKEAQTALMAWDDKFLTLTAELIQSGQMTAALAANNDNAQFIMGSLLMAVARAERRGAALPAPGRWQGAGPKAIELLEKSAAAGNGDAQLRLAYFYTVGKDVPQDLSKARQLLEQAAAAGNEPARRALERLSPNLSFF